MKVDTKQSVLHWAESIDSLRVFPRLFLLSCFIWTTYISIYLLQWYCHIPAPERTIEASGFATFMSLQVFGFLKLVYDQYSRNGRDWNSAPQVSTSSTVVATTTTQPTGATS